MIPEDAMQASNGEKEPTIASSYDTYDHLGTITLRVQYDMHNLAVSSKSLIEFKVQLTRRMHAWYQKPSHLPSVYEVIFIGEESPINDLLSQYSL